MANLGFEKNRLINSAFKIGIVAVHPGQVELWSAEQCGCPVAVAVGMQAFVNN